MNVEKVYRALSEDDQNSALGIMTAELNAQGYSVSIDGKVVEADGFFEGNYPDLENKLGVLTISLFKGNILDQEFCIEFNDFHQFTIKPKEAFDW